MTDAKGVLNPGLMPQTLDDLRKIAPARNLVDDVLVERWNRLAEVWRDHPEFRAAALRYASRRGPSRSGQPGPLARGRLPPDRAGPLAAAVSVAGRDPLGRPGRPALPLGDAGVELDRLLTRAVPAQVVAQIDDSVTQLSG